MSNPATEHTSPLPSSAPGAYHIGDRDTRPWGNYLVIDTGLYGNGEEFCKKMITINSLQILSLQSHKQRRETWTVKKGNLTVLRDGKIIELAIGESIDIPLESIHCMANTTTEDCVVEEIQEGVCREEDITRYMDAYNRSTEVLSSPQAAESFTAYREILIDINKARMERKNHEAA